MLYRYEVPMPDGTTHVEIISAFKAELSPNGRYTYFTLPYPVFDDFGERSDEIGYATEYLSRIHDDVT